MESYRSTSVSVHVRFLMFLTFANLCHASSSNSSDNPYSFVTWDAEKIADREFDYIVVGGGAAGCPLAVTLSSKFSVLLLERGTSPFGIADIERADAFLKPLSYANNYSSIAQIFISEDGVSNVRARILGGGTALNAGFYSRGSRKMISGEMGLDEALVNQSYHWIESRIVHQARSLKTWQLAMKDALLDANVFPDNNFTLEHVEGTKNSGSIFDESGKRHVAAELLDYANADNMAVLLNSTVGRVLFESESESESTCSRKPRSYGVEFMDGQGVSHIARLKGGLQSEVILSAGALGSPQLLMLSGIGPKAHLKSLGISVLVNSPAVGKGIADNPGTLVLIQPSKPLGWSPLQVVGITKNSQTYIEGNSNYDEKTKASTGILFQKLAFPKSQGEVRLKTKDPRENPQVKFNYYSDPDDIKTCVKGVRIKSAIFASPSMRRFGYRNPSTGKIEMKFIGKSFPANIGNLTAVEEYCKKSIITLYHFHGGCPVGSVVDHRNRVKGVEGLRVIDGSTFRDCPGTNPQATTMMLGRYKALKIIEERSCIRAFSDNK